MQKRLGDLALTNALLLSFSFSMMLEVPHVLEDMDASDWQLKYYFFALFWGNVCLLVSLLLCMFFTVQIGNAPRHSDKLLVIMRQATAYLGGGMYVPAHDSTIRGHPILSRFLSAHQHHYSRPSHHLNQNRKTKGTVEHQK